MAKILRNRGKGTPKTDPKPTPKVEPKPEVVTVTKEDVGTVEASGVVQSAAPGTSDTAAGKVEKTFYPGLKVDEKGNPTERVEGVPEDFDDAKHKVLRRRDFTDEAIWFDLRADEYEVRAKDYRQQAVDYRKLGSVVDRAKAKRLLAMQKRMNELMEQLESQGIDVEALLGDDDDEEDEADDPSKVETPAE
jgi:hypothetical protein